MAAHPDHPIPGDASAGRRGERRTRRPVDRLAGGHVPSVPGASITPSDVSQLVLDPSTEGGGLAAMHAKFLADFAKR